MVLHFCGDFSGDLCCSFLGFIIASLYYWFVFFVADRTEFYGNDF